MAGEKYTNIGKARWENANVGVIKWDPENKAGVASVIDETTGTVYEIGGGGGESGGGESDFSTAEIKIINNSSIGVEFATVEITQDGLNIGFNSLINTDKTHTLVLYTNIGLLQLYDSYEVDFSTTGDVSYADGEFTVTGDGTVTITNPSNT